MTLSDIRKSIARNLGMLSSDNSTIIEGSITKNGLEDEINRVWIEVVCQALMAKSSNDFTAEAKTNTFRDLFTVVAVDLTNKTITSSTGVFGTADVGAKIQHPTTLALYTIAGYITPKQVTITEIPSTTWVGVTAYILNNILILDTEAEDLKEILKLQIRYTSTSPAFIEADKQTVGNFKSISNSNLVFTSNPVYSLGSIQVNDVIKRCISYYPFPIDYRGEVKFTYTQQPNKLVNESDQPSLQIIGISDAIINGVTAWGFRMMNDLARSQAFEENNPALGGIVPKGLSMALKNYMPERGGLITYKGFSNRR